MTAFAIEPSLFVLPSEFASTAEVQLWFDMAERWLGEAAGSPFPWTYFGSCVSALVQTERFPTFLNMRSLAQRHGLSVAIDFVSRQLNVLLQDEDRAIESQCGTVDVDCADISITPKSFEDRNAVVRAQLEEPLAQLACDRADGLEIGRRVRLVVRDQPERAVILSAQLRGSMDRSSTIKGPRKLDVSLPAILSPNDLIGLLDVYEIFGAGAPEISKAVLRMAASTHPTVTPIHFHFGPHFFDSIQNSGIHTNAPALDKLIRVISAVITDEAKNMNLGLRHIRLSAAAGSNQRERAADGAKAWRVTVVTGGVGWRLHYWAIPSGPIVEMANVVRKGDPVEIPE